MPPRRRRAGYRPGQLSQELRAAIAVEQLDQITDPLELIDAVGDVFAALDAGWNRLHCFGCGPVAQLRRQGWSYDRLTDATKLSKTREAHLTARS